MKLYAVTVRTNLVVWAEDERAAMQQALTDVRDERRFSEVTDTTPLLKPEELPFGWDGTCLPYGRQDDTTINEIMGAK